MVVYDLRIEPKGELKKEDVIRIIEEAFKPYGGLSNANLPPEKVEILNID